MRELERDNYIASVAAKYSIREDALRRAVAKTEVMTGGRSVGKVYMKPAPSGKKKEENGNPAEKYLLTWMADEKEIYTAVKDYLLPEDFTEGITRDIADALYKGYEKGNFSAADILTRFAMEDRADEASAVINKQLYETDTSMGREKALTDLVISIKKKALSRNKGNDEDEDPLKKVREEKKALAELKKIRISI